MTRKPRLYIPDIPFHVIQRGNNRSACFFSEENYHFYLECLQSACSKHHISVQADVLMTNHAHMLLTPDSTEAISRVMQSPGRRYIQYINQTCGCSGTLREGGHKSSPVDAESYLLACYRHIDSNPVAAQMVDQPGAYPWSSYPANACGKPDAPITPHPLYLQPGISAQARQANYRGLFSASLGRDEIHAI